MNNVIKLTPFFSFVIRVANPDCKLEVTLESLIAQRLDFESNVEVFLCNTTKDKSVNEVCDRYASQFPSNIQHIKGESASVKSILYNVSGNYINFINPGDSLSPDCLYEIARVGHKKDPTIISVKVLSKNQETPINPLSRAYKEDSVINVLSEYARPLSHFNSLFFPSENKKKIATTLTDCGALAIASILAEQKVYIVASKPAYFTDRYNGGNPLLYAEKTKSESWYKDEIVELQNKLNRFSEYKFIQYSVMYAIQWRFKQVKQQTITMAEERDYKRKLFALLQNIDDSVILEMPHLSDEQKVFILGKKHDRNLVKTLKANGLKYILDGNVLYDAKINKPEVHIDLINYIEANTIRIEGFIEGLLFGESRLKMRVGDELYSVTPIMRPLKQTIFLGEVVHTRNCFKVELPLKNKTHIAACIDTEKENYNVAIIARKNTKLNQFCYRSYRNMGNYFITKRYDSLIVSRYTYIGHLKQELFYLLAVLRRLKLKMAKESLTSFKNQVASERHIVSKKTILKLSLKEARWLLVPVKAALLNVKTVAIRLSYYFVRLFIKKKIWLVSDRADIAGDNGEAFFRYVLKHRPEGVKLYFVVSRSSVDYQRMRQYGDVLDWGSIRYKFLFLCADKVISSHASDFVTNPFAMRFNDFSDLFNFDFIFLQHGIIYNDLSRWLNRYNKDIDLFVTSVRPEYESILSYPYDYDKSVVKLTGIPRYDLLNNKPKGKLILAPTWRTNLAGPIDIKTALREYNKNFKESEYYRFYQGLIDDGRVREALRKNGMIGELYLHLSLGAQQKDFVGNDEFQIKGLPYDYKTAFSEGTIMVTDYSSIQFDFAYLKKPIIYTQFDKETFYDGQNYDPGYFSFEENGFGPVSYDFETAVKEIVKCVNSGGTLDKKYLNRIEGFFYKFDKNNSRRVLKQILALDKVKKETNK